MMTRTPAILVLALSVLWTSSAKVAEAGELSADRVLKIHRTKTLPSAVSSTHKAKLDKVVSTLRRGDSAQAETQWVVFCEGYLDAGNGGDLERIGDWVLNQAYVSTGGADLDAEIAKWEGDLAAAGKDATVANDDLQRVLQRQQQTLRLMSDVSKMLHDSAQAAIREAG